MYLFLKCSNSPAFACQTTLCNPCSLSRTPAANLWEFWRLNAPIKPHSTDEPQTVGLVN